jgi:hypothetical protein
MNKLVQLQLLYMNLTQRWQCEDRGGVHLQYQLSFSEALVNMKLSPQFNLSVCIAKSVFTDTYFAFLKVVIIVQKSLVDVGTIITKSIPENKKLARKPARFIKRLIINE